MILENQQYWLSLEPTVEVVTIKEDLFLYDTLSGKSKTFKQVPELIQLLNEVIRNNNVIPYDLSENRTKLDNMVVEICSDFYADLIPRTDDQQPPIQLTNIINIQRSEEKIAKDISGIISLGDDILSYLKELTIYLNTGKNESTLSNAYKQFRYCNLDEQTHHELAYGELLPFLKTFDLKQLGSFNLAGANLLTYSELNPLIAYINAFNLNKNLLIHGKILLAYQEKFLQVAELFKAKHLYTAVVYLKAGDYTPRDIKNLIALKEQSGVKLFLHFIIESEKDYHLVEQTINEFKIVSYHIFPYHNGENLSFFKENIFLEEEDIIQQELSIKNIHTRKTVNTNFFGLLNIDTNGQLYASLNSRTIGHIRDIKAADAILNEFKEKTSWFDTKMNDATCGSCLYHSICPPKSNYEHYFGYSDLCSATPSVVRLENK